MSADKISVMLEEQLRTLGHKIRIDIIKRLHKASYPLSFTVIKKDILEHHASNVNFSFHLNALKASKLIHSTENGYLLTFFGKRIMKTIQTIEDILNDENKTIMIRTSKYSKEPFKTHKIEEYLIKEGKLNKHLAKKIALETLKRLKKTNIEYLTAPLMRELINAILIENGLEKIRHNLTRLGTPPCEVSKYFINSIPPDSFLKILGSDVSEQYLLLNLLPNHLADLYLSKEILLLHLNNWSLCPLSCGLETKSLINVMQKKIGTNLITSSNLKSNIRFVLNFFDFLRNFTPFFSEDIVLCDFDEHFFQGLKKSSEKRFLIEIIYSRIQNLFKNSLKYNPNLTFDIMMGFGNKNANTEKSYNSENLIEIINQCKLSSDQNISPYIIIKTSNDTIDSDLFSFCDKFIKNHHNNRIIFYNSRGFNKINSSFVRLNNCNLTKNHPNHLILDKVLINLSSISLKANGSDSLFLDLLKERVHSVFELFHYKEDFVKKKLNSNKIWANFLDDFFNVSGINYMEKAIRSVSFFNFSEAIEHHCGIAFERTQHSTTFGIKVLEELKSLITDKREEDNKPYVLTQPHYLRHSLNNFRDNSGGDIERKFNIYNPEFFKENTHHDLTKKVNIYQKIGKIIDGGLVFNINLVPEEDNLFKEVIGTLKKSDLPAFSINF